MAEQNDYGPKILEIIQKNGPTTPRELVKQLGQNTFVMGAILSQLSSTKKLKITHLKIGGTPAYYLNGQENRLIVLKKYLNQHEQNAFELLEQNQVLDDEKQTIQNKIALRNLKDFAKEIHADLHEKKYVFWKWYMISDEEAVEKIKNELAKLPIEKEEIQPPQYKEDQKTTEITEIIEEEPKVPDKNIEEETIKEETSNTEVETTITKTETPDRPAEKTEETVKEKNKACVEEEKIEDTKSSPIQTETSTIETKKEEIKKELEKKEPHLIGKLTELKTEIKKIEEKHKENKKIPFFKRLDNYFKENQIENKKLSESQKEKEYIITVPTPIGIQKYYCKAKSAHKIKNEDLEGLNDKAKSKNLQGVLITDAMLTKTAEQYLAENKNVSFKNI